MFIAPKDGISNLIWAAAQKLTPVDFLSPYGDGGFLRRFPFSFIPDEVDGIVSYKAHNLYNRCPDDARVVCFHGHPKPINATGWAGDYWRTCIEGSNARQRD